MPRYRCLCVILLRRELLWRYSFCWILITQFLVIESGLEDPDFALELRDLVVILLSLLLD